ncbi:hypothetical protein Tco_0585764 [Tanacetum coccineum]
MTVINAIVLSNFVSLQCLSSLLNALLQNTMAEQNVPAQPPTRTDEQIVPRSQWEYQLLPSIDCISKCSCYLPATMVRSGVADTLKKGISDYSCQHQLSHLIYSRQYTDELCISILEGNSMLAQPVLDRKDFWQADKAFHKNNVFLQFQMDECHKLLTNKVDLSNPEGHQIPQNLNEPLPLGGPPGQDILKMEMEMEIPSVKASANSDVKYFFTSAQVGDPSQDDVRLCLDDDLKKAQDHSQSQA